MSLPCPRAEGTAGRAWPALDTGTWLDAGCPLAQGRQLQLCLRVPPVLRDKAEAAGPSEVSAVPGSEFTRTGSWQLGLQPSEEAISGRKDPEPLSVEAPAVASCRPRTRWLGIWLSSPCWGELQPSAAFEGSSAPVIFRGGTLRAGWSLSSPESPRQRLGSQGGMLGGCQAPLCTLTFPMRTELGDQMSLRTGGSEGPQRKTRKSECQLLWGALLTEPTWFSSRTSQQGLVLTLCKRQRLL